MLDVYGLWGCRLNAGGKWMAGQAAERLMLDKLPETHSWRLGSVIATMDY